ncbi:putative cyclase-domain-containing protein [Elsinoe ampelina]|uniref:Putative cyclase-domain-containing protein n=1 Tax=Elsinoe ampelina TaxID=302913 RepID=A0A6A6G918_9PEZI|nr:putative cyclase-domain-containing protein [Elsinoe ampelina]
MSPITVPKYRELPIQAGAPAGAGWGVFDKDGKVDVYGTLNFITPETVLAAKEEIKLGRSVVLNLPMHIPYHVSRMGRKEFTPNFLSGAHGMKYCDDEIHINTQSSSQWDGLLHWPNQERACYYQNVPWSDAGENRNDRRLAIQSLSERGGIVARGVLLDFVRYAAAHDISYSAIDGYAITLAQLKDMIREQAIEIRQGDVLLVRTGLSKYLRSHGPEDKMPVDSQSSIGLDPTPDLLEWIWDSNFAAVGSDAIAVEAIPASDGSWLKLHSMAIPGWGMMLGELLDLEALAELCEKERRWTCFLTVAPLNIDGGAATTANTLAIM